MKITLFIDTKVLIEFPFDYVFDFGIEILDDDDVRFSGIYTLLSFTKKSSDRVIIRFYYLV